MMTDQEVQARLRAALAEVAATTAFDEHRAISLEPPVSQPVRSGWSRPLAVAASAFVAVMLALGMFALVVRGPGAQPSPPATSPIVVTDRYPVLGPMAPGVSFVAEVTVPPEEPRHLKLVVGRRTASGFEDAVNILVWENDDFVKPPEGSPVVVGGYEGVAVPLDEFEADAAGATVFWYRGERLLQAHDPRGRLDVVLSVAGAVDIDPLADFGVSALRLGSMPDGFEILADAFINRVEPIPIVIAESARNPSAPRVTMTLSRSPSAIGAIVLVGDGHILDVRGTQGYGGVSPGGRYYIAWEEAPGLVVKVSADSATADVEALVAIANDVTFVDEVTWRSFYPDAAGPAFPETTRAP